MTNSVNLGIGNETGMAYHAPAGRYESFIRYT